MSKLRLTIKGPVALYSFYDATTREQWESPIPLSLREHFGYANMLSHDRRVYEKAEAAMLRSWKRQTYRKV